MQAPSPGAVAAFEREAKFLRALEHPAIPRFLASFEEGTGVHTRYYLAQELVDGTALDRLDEHWYSEAEIVGARAPGARDPRLSPDAVADGDPSRHQAGEPHQARRRLDRARRFRRGARPRHDRGRRPRSARSATCRSSSSPGIVDATTDGYALGMTLMHLLTRQEPWRLLASKTAVNASPALRAFLDKLTAADPGQRFASAKDALAALDAPAASSKKRASRADRRGRRCRVRRSGRRRVRDRASRRSQRRSSGQRDSPAQRRDRGGGRHRDDADRAATEPARHAVDRRQDDWPRAGRPGGSGRVRRAPRHGDERPRGGVHERSVDRARRVRADPPHVPGASGPASPARAHARHLEARPRQAPRLRGARREHVWLQRRRARGRRCAGDARRQGHALRSGVRGRARGARPGPTRTTRRPTSCGSEHSASSRTRPAARPNAGYHTGTDELPGRQVDLDFKDAPLHDVLSMLSRRARHVQPRHSRRLAAR